MKAMTHLERSPVELHKAQTRTEHDSEGKKHMKVRCLSTDLKHILS